eukprot:2648976-Rhodomonas_salina.2
MLTYIPMPLFYVLNTFKSLPRPTTPGSTISIILLFVLLSTLLPGAHTAHASLLNQNPTVLNPFLLAMYSTLGECGFGTTIDAYLIDSGCTTSIIADGRLLSDFRLVNPVNIRGLTGDITYTWMATLTLPVRTIQGKTHLLRIENVYWDETGHYNLVSSNQLNKTGFKVVLD